MIVGCLEIAASLALYLILKKSSSVLACSLMESGLPYKRKYGGATPPRPTKIIKEIK